MSTRFLFRSLVLLVPVLLVGCSSSKTTRTRDVRAKDSEWVQASPILEQQIEDEAKRLPWTHGFERLEQIRWFASIGEPAYPALLELALDERDDVAAAALAALGATSDRRLVAHIRDLGWSESRLKGDLGLERARTLVRLGDWEPIPVLIEGLSDERLFTRGLCLDALREATNETKGYDPRATPEERQAAVDRWRVWWQDRSREGRFSKS